MSNCIEQNPIKSLVVYTITIVVAVWGILTFVLDDNKDKLHEKQIDNLETKISIMEERIKYLERENNNLRTDNYKYVEWLQSMPQSVSFFSERIKKLEAEISKKDTISLIENISNSQRRKNREYYIESSAIREGGAFIDKKTGATIGIANIKTNQSAEAVINLPNQKEKILQNVKAGNKWEFIYDEKKYELIVAEVNYIGSSFKIILREK